MGIWAKWKFGSWFVADIITINSAYMYKESSRYNADAIYGGPFGFISGQCNFKLDLVRVLYPRSCGELNMNGVNTMSLSKAWHLDPSNSLKSSCGDAYAFPAAFLVLGAAGSVARLP